MVPHVNSLRAVVEAGEVVVEAGEVVVEAGVEAEAHTDNTADERCAAQVRGPAPDISDAQLEVEMLIDIHDGL